MARTGRPPKPVEVKQRTGNPGKRALPTPATVLPATTSIPRAPDGLGAPGKHFWADVWNAAQQWVSTTLDSGTVEMAARTYDECATYRKLIKDLGPLLLEPIVTPAGPVVGSDGEPLTKVVPNPAVRLLRDAEKQLERWLVQLALTPTERARLGLAQVKQQSKLEQLIEARERRARG